MRIRVLAIVLTGLLLSGCVQTGATLSAEATYLLGAAIDYTHRVHDKRRSIEEQCWLSVMREIDVLRKNGGTEQAVRVLLLKSYPELVTLALLKKIRDDPNSILSLPPGCPVEDEPGEMIIGPPLKGELVPEDPIS